VNPTATPDTDLTPLDIARPVAASMDQAIGEATTVMGAMVTELMRRSLRGGVLKIGEQLENYVGERVDLTIAERRPAIEAAAATVAEQTAFTTAAKVAGEEVYALEQRTKEVTRTLAGQIEEADRRAQQTTSEVERALSGRIEEKAQHLVGHIEEKAQHLAGAMAAGDQQAIQATQEATRVLTGHIEQAEKRAGEAAQAHVGQRVQELMDKAAEGAQILKARIKSVKVATVELRQQLATEREARAEMAQRLDKVLSQNEQLSARIAELERPRGLGRLWAWLFRRGR
jgi:hypothetical protein